METLNILDRVAK